MIPNSSHDTMPTILALHVVALLLSTQESAPCGRRRQVLDNIACADEDVGNGQGADVSLYVHIDATLVSHKTQIELQGGALCSS